MKVFLKILIALFLIVGIVGLFFWIIEKSFLTGIIWLLVFIQLAIVFYIPQLAMSKGYSGFLAFLLSLFVPLFGSLIIIGLLPDNKVSYQSYQSNNINDTTLAGRFLAQKVETQYRCRKCGQEVNENISKCPKCGNESFIYW